MVLCPLCLFPPAAERKPLRSFKVIVKLSMLLKWDTRRMKKGEDDPKRSLLMQVVLDGCWAFKRTQITNSLQKK